ncbi:uncharacterized protein LOC135836445 isoform X2 [Planococcus citri]|uniref:uncharacterized protein LOC135836445 isoform X2 n=1 Tax=Planococcus citri TaxID=170843 RepID=UPI0031F75590
MLTAQAKHFSAMKFAFTLYHLCILIFVKFNTVKGENTISEFTDHLIVPHLFPTPPKEICSVIYEPGLIILTGKPYFPYQIQGLPEIIWNHKEETFYTVMILGAFQRKAEYAITTAPVFENETNISPPEQWWHEWVKVNVFENDLSSSGTVLQPFLESSVPQPHTHNTHDIIHIFAVYEQSKELEFVSDDGNTTLQALLFKYFTPISNFKHYFNESIFLAGNFFYAVPKKIVLDTSVVRRLRWKD